MPELEKLEAELNTSEKFQLPAPPVFMAVKTYQSKFAEPLVRQLKAMVKTILMRYYAAMDHYIRLNLENQNLYRKNEQLASVNAHLIEENRILKTLNKDYRLLQKVFGKALLEELLKRARAAKLSHKKDQMER